MTAQQLKNSILQMAVQGKLVPQDPNDEPASVLLERIRAEKERLIKEKKIKREKNPSVIFKGADNTPYEKIGDEVRSLADEVPFDIPDSWEWVRMKYICQLIDGEKIQNASYHNLDARYMRGKAEPQTLNSGKYVSQGTYLILVDGENSGEVFIAPEDGYMGSTFKVLWITTQLFAPYVLKFIELYKEPLRNAKRGAAIPHLNKELFFNLPIPMPPIEEQRRIVEKIDEVSSAVSAYDFAYRKTESLNTAFPEALKKSILQEAVQGKLVPQDPSDEPAEALLERIRAEKQRLIKEGKIKKDKHESVIFRRDNSHYEKLDGVERCIDDELPFEIPESWAWTYLGNISFVTKLAGFEYTKYIAPALTNHGIPLFKGKNIQNGKLIEHFEWFIPETVSDELWRSQLSKRCLLTPYVGSIGNVAVFPGTYKAHLGSNVGKIEPYSGNGVLIEYILFYLRSTTGYEQLTKYKKATAQESISIDAIRNVLMPIPPLNEQERIVSAIDTALSIVQKL